MFLPRFRVERMAIGLAAVVCVAPASFAHDSRPARPSNGELSGGLRLETPEHGGVSVARPIGKVWVGPEGLDGEPSYVRRTIDGKGITIVEVSTTPFAPVLASNEGPPGVIARPDQPAGW